MWPGILVKLMLSDPLGELGEYLSAAEARGVAAMFESGERTKKALLEVNSTRREKLKHLLIAAGLGHENSTQAAQVLRAISGAKSIQHQLTPVWTMPGHEANVGRLTNQFHALVRGARQSVTCATYNFETTSQMWKTLAEASAVPGVDVKIYLDAVVADALKVKEQLPQATVYRPMVLPSGKIFKSHAKFVIIDHGLMLLTSANFSYSAENLNIEFGVLIEDQGFIQSVEDVLFSKNGVLYERV